MQTHEGTAESLQKSQAQLEKDIDLIVLWMMEAEKMIANVQDIVSSAGPNKDKQSNALQEDVLVSHVSPCLCTCY
jgi:hypothetical protein